MVARILELPVGYRSGVWKGLEGSEKDWKVLERVGGDWNKLSGIQRDLGLISRLQGSRELEEGISIRKKHQLPKRSKGVRSDQVKRSYARRRGSE